ncbi:hypothetical protein OSB04_019729 [Centaurea solstitialis]|uniref:Integrase catalytic domain-containing protein n=1 Tax=Centaurea solstitialis TaxID=347529 RepID=A0AA38T4C0_9ASTR|nr:hypothetical protein OSB04_019729 [Centaurea solstitialis]
MEFQNEVQNQLDRKIKFLRSDRGGEYLSQEFENPLMECWIVSQLTPPYTPQMNGVSEGRNRTLLDMIWGCEVYVKRTTSEKLKPKSDKCIFVGYPKTIVGYYFYNPNENKVFVAQNGEFLEDKFLSLENTRNDVDLQEVEEDITIPSVEPLIQQEHVEPQPKTVKEVQTHDFRRSTRIRQELDRYLGFLIAQDNGDLNEPASYGDVVLGSDSEQWLEAMKAEMQSIFKWKACRVTLYRGMIGSLLYLTASHPDIMYSTCLCARYQAEPKESHLTAVKRIFRYLKGTPNLGIRYAKDSGFDLTMANTGTNTNNLSPCSILEKDNLTRSNFHDWECNLQIVLRHERKWYILEQPLGEAPPANANATVGNAYRKYIDDLLDVGCLMLTTMSPEFQTGLMNTNAYDIIR